MKRLEIRVAEFVNQILLSACLIVKNEIATLEQCLLSLQGVVDEVIVVDTGSTDGTVDLARRMGAKVFHDEWDHDFARARNVSLRHASGEWILVIDADEYLDDIKKRHVRCILAQSQAEAFFVNVINYLGSLHRLSRAMPIRVMRIFRRGYFYEGTIHEQIASSVYLSGKPVEALDLDLHHVGYTEEFLKQRRKNERNVELIMKELQRDPDDLFQKSNLMAELLMQKDYAACARLAEQAFRVIERMPKTEWPNFSVRILMNGCVSLWNLQRSMEAVALAQKGIAYFPWFTDIRYFYATMQMSLGQWHSAMENLHLCRVQGDAAEGLVEYTQGVGSFLAARDLAVIWTCLGDDLVACQWFLQAFIENPSLEGVISPLLTLLPFDEEYIYQNIEPKITEPSIMGDFAETYALLNRVGVVELIERTEHRFGPSEQTERARITLLARQSRAKLYQYVLEKNTESHWYWMGLYDLNRGDLPLAMASLKRAGTAGDYFLRTEKWLRTSAETTWSIGLVVKDLLAVGAERLLKAWLPRAVDGRAVWLTIYFSPLQSILLEMEWPGQNVLECEQNAIRHFRLQDWGHCTAWLEQARKFTSSVTQYVLWSQMAIHRGDLAQAQNLLQQGRQEFSESQVLKNMLDAVRGALQA